MEGIIIIGVIVFIIVGIKAFSRNKKVVQGMSQQSYGQGQVQQPNGYPPPPGQPVTLPQPGAPISLTPQEMMVLDIFKQSGMFGKPPKRNVKRNRFSIWAVLKNGDPVHDQQLMNDIALGVDGMVAKGLAIEPDKNPESKIGISLTDAGYNFVINL